jgi:DNA-binding MarR family transcriptional regulator
MNARDREESLTLELLETIEQKNDITQRHLADRLGVALGLANSYLKRCVRKGLVKMHQAPANRYLYYLTPKGFAEKSRLTARYFSSSLRFYRRAGDSCGQVYTKCIKAGWKRIILYGASDLAEIASISAHEFGIEIIGTYAPESNKRIFLGRPVWKTNDQLPEYDAILFAELTNPAAAYMMLAAMITKEKILVPAVIGLNQDL